MGLQIIILTRGETAKMTFREENIYSFCLEELESELKQEGLSLLEREEILRDWQK